MVSENRSGPALDEQFDFMVSSTGDIRVAEGIDELKKDIAFKMVNGTINIDPLTDFLGQPPSGNLTSKIKSRAKDIALSDDEVSQVDDETFEVNFNERRDEIEIKMNVITTTGSVQIIEVIER